MSVLERFEWIMPGQIYGCPQYMLPAKNFAIHFKDAFILNRRWWVVTDTSSSYHIVSIVGIHQTYANF